MEVVVLLLTGAVAPLVQGLEPGFVQADHVVAVGVDGPIPVPVEIGAVPQELLCQGFLLLRREGPEPDRVHGHPTDFGYLHLGVDVDDQLAAVHVASKVLLHRLRGAHPRPHGPFRGGALLRRGHDQLLQPPLGLVGHRVHLRRRLAGGEEEGRKENDGYFAAFSFQ